MTRWHLMLLLAVAVSASTVARATIGSPRTVGEFIREMQREMLTPSVSYCSEAFPNKSQELSLAHDRFKRVTDEAARPLRERMGELQFKPMPAETEDLKPGLVFLEQGKREDKQSFCADILHIMQTVTVEELRQVVEDEYARMVRAAAERASQGK